MKIAQQTRKARSIPNMELPLRTLSGYLKEVLKTMPSAIVLFIVRKAVQSLPLETLCPRLTVHDKLWTSCSFYNFNVQQVIQIIDFFPARKRLTES